MKYLYTTNPDKHCHEVAPGVWGRPAHTSEQAKLRKLGWVDSIHKLKEADHGLRKDEEEGREESKEVSFDDAEYFVVSCGNTREEMDDRHVELFGKKPHSKMSDEKLRDKLQAKLDEMFSHD